jgi:hypothetical protein
VPIHLMRCLTTFILPGVLFSLTANPPHLGSTKVQIPRYVSKPMIMFLIIRWRLVPVQQKFARRTSYMYESHPFTI